jgi:DNA replication protein DnaC
MNNQETIDLLYNLKLKGMSEAFKAMSIMPVSERPSMELAIAKMAEAERMYRANQRTQMYLKTSKLRFNASLEDIECSSERNLTKSQLSEIGDCSFIRRAENILITGLTGCGKTYLACALGRQACYLGFRTEYLNMNKFIEKIALAKLEGNFLKVITHLEKNELIILDDFGLHVLDDVDRLVLLEMMEDRHGLKSTIISSQLPIKVWYDIIGESTIADAILDRLVNGAFRIEIKSKKSLRE